MSLIEQIQRMGRAKAGCGELEGDVVVGRTADRRWIAKWSWSGECGYGKTPDEAIEELSKRMLAALDNEASKFEEMARDLRSAMPKPSEEKP